MTYLTRADNLASANDWERMRLLLLTLRTEIDMPCNLSRELLDMATMIARVNCSEDV